MARNFSVSEEVKNMSNKQSNSVCAICGRPYYCCNDSLAAKSFTPWKKIVDSMEHYKIFMALMSYTNQSIDKKQAADELKSCDLSGIEGFPENIRAAIDEILDAPRSANISKGGQP